MLVDLTDLFDNLVRAIERGGSRHLDGREGAVIKIGLHPPQGRDEAFIADGNLRLKKSKWMMLIILPLVVTFLIDAVDIFILEMFR